MKVNPLVKDMGRDALEQVASQLMFIMKKYEEMLLSLIGEDAYIHFSRHVQVKLMRADAEEMEDGEAKTAAFEIIERMESELAIEAADKLINMMKEGENDD